MTLTSAELTAMRDAINQLMPQTCNILTVTLAADGQGGNTQTWGTAYSSVSCRLDVVSGMEQVTGGALQPYTHAMLSVPYDTTITQSDRVEVGSNTYAIKTVNVDQGWIAVKRCELEIL